MLLSFFKKLSNAYETDPVLQSLGRFLLRRWAARAQGNGNYCIVLGIFGDPVGCQGALYHLATDFQTITCRHIFRNTLCTKNEGQTKVMIKLLPCIRYLYQ